MQTVKLSELPVGALFIRHDEWGDGETVYVKLYNFNLSVKSVCQVGTTSSGRVNPLSPDIEVQQVKVGNEMAVLAFCLASSLDECRRTSSFITSASADNVPASSTSAS